jgi:hypothetical protein
VAIGDTRSMPAPLHATPLHVWAQRECGPPHRGLPFDPSRVAKLVEDGRDRARADAAAFVESGLRTCEGTAYARLRGPMAYRTTHDGVPRPRGLYRVSLHPLAYSNSAETLDALVRADRIDEHDAFNFANAPHAVPPPAAPEITGYDGDPADLVCDDADISVACNKGLCAVLNLVRRTMAKAGDALREPDAVRAAIAGLDGYAARAIVAGVSTSEHGEVLHRLDGVFRTLLARCPEDTPGRAVVERQSAWIAGHLLPRVAAPHADLDGAALAGLAR